MMLLMALATNGCCQPNWNRTLASGYNKTPRCYWIMFCDAAQYWSNAVVTQAVANAVGIPWVYEVRGQLADTWASTRSPEAVNTDYYQLFQAREQDAPLAADGVVTLGEQMKNNLAAFGADADEIVLSPNAVGGQFLKPPGDTRQARIELGLDPDCEYVG